jgi:Protein of unknown function (DUF3375)
MTSKLYSVFTSNRNYTLLWCPFVSLVVIKNGGDKAHAHTRTLLIPYICRRNTTYTLQQYDFDHLFHETNALRLLRDKRAALILSFLKMVFAQDQKSISQDELTRRLTDYLQRFDDTEIFDDTDQLDLGADLFDRHRNKAKQLLRDWEDSKKRYLKGDNNAEGQYEYTLTEHVVRAWQWLEGLEKKEFTGTRSRLNDIFEKLHRVVENGREKTDDERIEALAAQKLALDQEINQIKAGQSPYRPLTKVELSEEYESLMEQVRALSADFKSVEGRFERIRADILKRQALSDESKGLLLHQALDARDDLDSTPQGQSFNAFFEALRDPQRQLLFTQRVEELLQLLKTHGIPVENDTTLRRLYRFLLHEAQPVLEANRRIADRIRRFVGEQNREKRQLLRQRLTEVKAALLDPDIQKRLKPQAEVWSIDTDRAHIAFPLEKTIRTEPDARLERFALPRASEATAPEIKMTDDGAIGIKIQAQLATALAENKKITLKSLAETYQIEEGMAEVLAYLNLVAAGQNHTMSAEELDTFLLEAEGKVYLEGPRVEFVGEVGI